MSTYATIDWKGLTSGIDRHAQNQRTYASIDAQREANLMNYASNMQRIASEDLRARDLQKSELETRTKLAELQRANDVLVAETAGKYNLINTGFRIIPTVLGSVKDNGSKPSNSNKPQGNTGVSTKPVVAITPAKSGSLATNLPTFRTGSPFLDTKVVLPAETSGLTDKAIQRTTLSNSVRDLVSKIGVGMTGAVLTTLPAIALMTTLAL